MTTLKHVGRILSTLEMNEDYNTKQKIGTFKHYTVVAKNTSMEVRVRVSDNYLS